VRILVNGEEYSSWDEVPEETRRLMRKVLPDADHNGIPDAVEGKDGPGVHVYKKRILVKRTSRTTRVLRTEEHPGFRYTMTNEDVSEALPKLDGDRVAPDPMTSDPGTPPTPPSDGPVILNGVEVGPDGQPLAKKHWWRR
jgi:hypothetical protein